MAGRETATVETLTASVKTLMVGARQVTLTIFKQLDVVNYDEMTPFGRVNPTGHQSDWATVVGKRNVSGELVRATVPITWEAILQHTGQAKNAREVIDYENKIADPMYHADMAWRRQEHSSAGRLQAIADESGQEAWYAEHMREQEQEVRDAVAPHAAVADEVVALPLIVLAGLA